MILSRSRGREIIRLMQVVYDCPSLLETATKSGQACASIRERALTVAAFESRRFILAKEAVQVFFPHLFGPSPVLKEKSKSTVAA